jgi:hypothetical protein
MPLLAELRLSIRWIVQSMHARWPSFDAFSAKIAGGMCHKLGLGLVALETGGIVAECRLKRRLRSEGRWQRHVALRKGATPDLVLVWSSFERHL